MIIIKETESLSLTNKAELITMRKRISALAKSLEFSTLKEQQLTTATMELGSNILRHAGTGEVTLEVIQENGQDGIRASFRDNGPGIQNLDNALTDGYSTSTSLGQGLPGTKRLADSFSIDSQAGKGTRVTIEKWR